MIPDAGPGARLHLLGICGSAMASLAGLLQSQGYRVTGSDQDVYPPMSDVLAKLGIEVRSPYRPENLPDDLSLVVVGNALSRGNPELESVLERGLPYVSMPEVLKEVFLRTRKPIVVAGTHGKTTTSSLIAWILESSGRAPGFLVGGIPLNFDTSFRAGAGEDFVVEGDEYDTAYFDKGPKFLHYLPRVAVLSNVEFDHADIYRDLADVERAFRLFVNLVPGNGLLVLGRESELAAAIGRRAPCAVETFAVRGDADWVGQLEGSDEDGSYLLVNHRGKRFLEAYAPMWGNASLRNALASVAVSHFVGCTAQEIATALSRFRGVRRRLELRGRARGVTVIDDFAHHPTAIFETLAAARARWPHHRLWGVFEPRSFTARSRVFQRELAEALSGADEVILAEVLRTSRLSPEEELSEERLVEDLNQSGTTAVFLPRVDDIVEHLVREAREGDVVMVMSNGSFGGLHGKLLAALAP
ncbi:MAG TPA: UDP-N-acetylmuramate:L-alanyl-gamma-D-glutamyl-meso-diaminopimelate ligase [Vicinamibacteria bacterium]|nr:UDP-N-acetylmuramate:L-alanyl-gamma-D-glutamyl-meso-diaminopimelate ligase [Vicinamibacteria bacterium]